MGDYSRGIGKLFVLLPVRKPWENRVMSVRLMRPGELSEVTEMMRALWPDAGDYDFGDETVFVWERSEEDWGALRRSL